MESLVRWVIAMSQCACSRLKQRPRMAAGRGPRGARDCRPRYVRIFSFTGTSKMAATALRSSPQLEQCAALRSACRCEPLFGGAANESQCPEV